MAQAPWAFINVTHVVGQPLPIYPNAPTLQTPMPGGPAPPPPPPGGMLPPFLPGKTSIAAFSMQSDQSLHLRSFLRLFQDR